VEKVIDLLAGPDDSGTRLDVFLSTRLAVSRSSASRIIGQGLVMVDGSRKREAFRLKTGMRIQGTYCEEPADNTPAAREIALEILHEDPWIIVINKQAGLTVHPGAGNKDETLVNGLLARYPEIAHVGDPLRPGIVHRLDKMTSGVMMAARHNDAYPVLVKAFKTHEHLRKYYAIIYGHMPQLQGTIETFMQRNPRSRMKMTSRTTQGRKAITSWKVIRQWEGFSLLELILKTGRTHQIRVHLSDLGVPVVGDEHYGGRKRLDSIKSEHLQTYIRSIGRQMLHASTLGITHPVTGEYMEFTSDLPDDMKSLIAKLDETSEQPPR